LDLPTNGAGAFGASMNLETNTIQSKPSAVISAAAGSFGTYRTTFQTGTGLLKNHWYFEGRDPASVPTDISTGFLQIEFLFYAGRLYKR